jgi:hypothetical protein
VAEGRRDSAGRWFGFSCPAILCGRGKRKDGRMRRISFPKFLFIAEGVLWIVLGIGFAVYAHTTLKPWIIAIVTSFILAYSAWLIIMGALLREGNRKIYFLAVATTVVTIAVSVLDDLGIADFSVVAYNFILLLSLILFRKNFLAGGTSQKPPV